MGDKNILKGKLNAAIMQGGKTRFTAKLALPKIENPGAKQSLQKKTRSAPLPVNLHVSFFAKSNFAEILRNQRHSSLLYAYIG